MGLLQSTFSGEDFLPIVSGNEATERESVVATETEGSSERQRDPGGSQGGSLASVTQLSQDPMIQRDEKHTGFSSAKPNIQTAPKGVDERRADSRKSSVGHFYASGKSTTSTAQVESEKQKDSCTDHRCVNEQANFILKQAIDSRPAMRLDSQQKPNERQHVKSTLKQHKASKCSPSNTSDAKQQSERSLGQTTGEQEMKSNAAGSVNTIRQSKQNTAAMQGQDSKLCKEMNEGAPTKCNPQQNSNCKTSKLSNASLHNNANKASLANQKQLDYRVPKMQQQQVENPKRPIRPQRQGTTITGQPNLVPSKSSHTESKEKVTDIGNRKELRNIKEQETVASKTMSSNNEELRCNLKQSQDVVKRGSLCPTQNLSILQKQESIIDKQPTTSRLQGNPAIQQEKIITQPEVKPRYKPKDCIIDMSQFDDMSQSTKTKSEHNFNKHSGSSSPSHGQGVSSSGHPRSPVTVAPKQVWNTCAVSGGKIDTCSQNFGSPAPSSLLDCAKKVQSDVTVSACRQTPYSPLLESRVTRSSYLTTQVKAERESSQRVSQETCETRQTSVTSRADNNSNKQITETSNSSNKQYRNDGLGNLAGKAVIHQSTTLRASSPELEQDRAIHAEAPKTVSWENSSNSFNQGVGDFWSTQTVREHESKLSYRVIAKATKENDAATEPSKDESFKSCGHKPRDQEQLGLSNNNSMSNTSPCSTTKNQEVHLKSSTEMKNVQQQYKPLCKQEWRQQPQTASFGASKMKPHSQKDVKQVEGTKTRPESSEAKANWPQLAQDTSVLCDKVKQIEEDQLKSTIILDDLATKLAKLQIETGVHTGKIVASHPLHSSDKDARVQRSTSVHEEQNHHAGASERGDYRKPDELSTTACNDTSSSLTEDKGLKKTRLKQTDGQSQHKGSFELKKPQLQFDRSTLCVQKDKIPNKTVNRGAPVSLQTSNSVVSAGKVQTSPSSVKATSGRKNERTGLNRTQTQCSLAPANAVDGKAVPYNDGCRMSHAKCEETLKKANPYQSKLATTTPDRANGKPSETKGSTFLEGRDSQFRKSIATAPPVAGRGVQRRELSSKARFANLNNSTNVSAVKSSESAVQPQSVFQSEVGSNAKQQLQCRERKNSGSVAASYQTAIPANYSSSPSSSRNVQSAQNGTKSCQKKPEHCLKANTPTNPSYQVSVQAEPLFSTKSITSDIRSKKALHGTRHADGLNLLSDVVDEEHDITQGLLTTKEVSPVKQEKNFLGNLKNKMSSVFSTKKGKKGGDGKKYVGAGKCPSSPVMSPKTSPGGSPTSQTNSKMYSQVAEATSHGMKQPSAGAIEQSPGTSQLSSSQPDNDSRIGLTSLNQLPKGHVPEDNQKSFTGIPSKSSTLTTSAKIAEKQGVQTQRILPITSTKQEPVPSRHTYQGLPTTKGVPTKTVGQGIVPPSNGKSVTSNKVKAAAETSQKQNLNAVKEGKKESPSSLVSVKTRDNGNGKVAEQAPKNPKIQAQELKENQKKRTEPTVASQCVAVEKPDGRRMLEHSKEAVERSAIPGSEDGAEGAGKKEVSAGGKTSPIKKAERKERRKQKRQQKKALERMRLDQAESASQGPSYWDSPMITTPDCDPSVRDTDVMDTILEENEPELGLEVGEDVREIENPLAAINLTPLKEKPVVETSPQSKAARKRAGRRRRGKYEYSAPTTRRKPINCCCEDVCDHCRPPRDE